VLQTEHIPLTASRDLSGWLGLHGKLLVRERFYNMQV